MKAKHSKLKTRWIKARPGSVLILVIALLVLLALLGTAYLSSTQTERYSSQQNSVNTEADLLVQGVIDATESNIISGLFGSTSTGTQFRPAGQEMPTYNGITAIPAPATTGYHSYTSGLTETYLADRWPVVPAINNVATLAWNAISFPLFTDGSGDYSFDSPFDGSATLYLAANKNQVQSLPTYRTINGQLYPAMLYYIPASATSQGTGVTLQTPGGPVFYAATTGVYLTPNGVQSATGLPVTGGGQPDPTSSQWGNWANFAASSSGDGIADSGMFKLPVGQINNITYYASYRVIDNNSAINVSSAWTAQNDPGFPTGTPLPNYGFSRANIGLNELLFQTPPTANSPSAAGEMAALNTYRFDSSFVTPTALGPGAPSLALTPTADQPVNTLYPLPTNFQWYSYGDEIENQLIRRPGNPGWSSGSTRFAWLGLNQSAALAYHFSLKNPNASPSYIEQLLPNELLNYATARSSPYSPTQTVQWYNDLFGNYQGPGTNYIPLRTIVTGSNPVSNGTASRLGNSSATTIPTWTTGVQYNFGDWVMDGPVGYQRSFVCIRRHIASAGTEPQATVVGTTTPPYAGYNSAATGYWAGAQVTPLSTTARPPGLPFVQQAIKASVNTATFEELWLAFAQAMTDSIGMDNSTAGLVTNGVAHWQPPQQPQIQATTGGTTTQTQMPMFRSVLRTGGNVMLTAAQMLKLRAALAAINTIDLRDSDDDVSSKHIVLDDSFGVAQYDVEVYGTELQPYISEIVLQTDGNPDPNGTNNFIAIKLCNPYPKVITLTNWQFATVNRNAGSTLTMVPAGAALTAAVQIPAAAADGTPGILVVYDGTAPTDCTATFAANATQHLTTTVQTMLPVTGLFAATVSGTQASEIFLMRPRSTRNSNQYTKNLVGADDVFDETTFLADRVPVDQIDFTGIQIPTPKPPPASTTILRYLYRRGSYGGGTTSTGTGTGNGTTTTTVNKAWNFVYPGMYSVAQGGASGRYFDPITQTPAIFQVTYDPTDTTHPPFTNLGAADGSTQMPATLMGATTATAANQSTYYTLPIELNNTHMAGPSPVYTAANGSLTANPTNTFPFGEFARNADMLQIPFIGAYRIRAVTPVNPTVQTDSNNFVELNSVTMDSALSNDTTLAFNNGAGAYAPYLTGPSNGNSQAMTEQIGRFCPVGQPLATSDQQRMDFGSTNTYYHYHWAKKIFNYLTVQSPADDFYPNVDPAPANSQISPPSDPITGAKYPSGPPAPVANNNSSITNSLTAGMAEDTVGVEGQININTAPLPVLASLPFTTPYNAQSNLAIAQGIIAYRNQNGVFKSIFDLYKVPAFYNQNMTLIANNAAGAAQGVFSPTGIGTGATAPANGAGLVRYDFQDRFVLLNNISNLITTRSDSFTCYVLLQGWRNAGTGNPTLAVQRRAAFFVDRNNITPANTKPTYFKVPNQ